MDLLRRPLYYVAAIAVALLLGLFKFLQFVGERIRPDGGAGALVDAARDNHVVAKAEETEDERTERINAEFRALMKERYEKLSPEFRMPLDQRLALKRANAVANIQKPSMPEPANDDPALFDVAIDTDGLIAQDYGNFRNGGPC